MHLIVPNHVLIRQCLHWVNCRYRDIFTDHRTRKLFTGSAMILFLEATLRQRKSLKDISENLLISPWLQKWVGMDSVSDSALYDKLENLPLLELQEMYQEMVHEIAKHYQGKTGLSTIGPLYAVDSTEIVLPPQLGLWAYTTEKKNFVRMHTCLRVADEDSVCPHKIVLATGAVHEQEVLSHLVTDAEATYVFDRGYVNYERYAQWAADGIPFVARLKHPNVCEILESHPLPANTSIRLDAEVRIKQKTKKISAQLRLVEYDYWDRHGNQKRIRVLTNRRDLTAEQISEIYRGRWKVESFFKWMKQHVNLTKLYSYKKNAVWNQIYLSLIAHALCELIRLTMKPTVTCWQILQTILRNGTRADMDLEEVLQTVHPRKKRQPAKQRGKPPNGWQGIQKKREIVT